MKKRMLTLMLAALLCSSALTACADTETETPADVTDVPAAEEIAEENIFNAIDIAGILSERKTHITRRDVHLCTKKR